jgi:hypothetical protein
MLHDVLGSFVRLHAVSRPQGPLGMAASFNRTNWRLKGQVFGTEMRAFNNARWPRFSYDATDFIALTGYGPNINIARDPRCANRLLITSVCWPSSVPVLLCVSTTDQSFADCQVRTHQRAAWRGPVPQRPLRR